MFLEANGYMHSKETSRAKSLNIRLARLQRVLSKNTELIMNKPSHLLLNQWQYESYLL